jgi:hypothetical protein
MCHIYPRFRRLNRGYAAALVGVELVSGAISVIPCKDFTKRSWMKACTKMARYGFNSISLFQSDRDAAIAQNDYFCRFIKKKFDISWNFLR